MNNMKNTFYTALSDIMFLVALVLIIQFVSLVIDMTRGAIAHQTTMETLYQELEEQIEISKQNKKRREEADSRLAKAVKAVEKKKQTLDALKMLVDSSYADSKPEVQLLKTLRSAGLGGHDLDLVLKEIHDLPGDTLHLVVDSTGSMESHMYYFESLVYAIVRMSGKDLAAITWYRDGKAKTVKGRLDEVVTKLMKHGFGGGDECVRRGLLHARSINLDAASYILIGDQESTDGLVKKGEMDAPVFTLPIAPHGSTLNPEESRLLADFKAIADETGGKMMTLQFK